LSFTKEQFPSLHRFSLQPYYELGELGLLDRWTKLLDGIIIDMEPVSPWHASRLSTNIRATRRPERSIVCGCSTTSLPNTSSLMAALARWSNPWPFSGASIKAIRTLISGLARIRTFIVSPSTMPVIGPGPGVCSGWKLIPAKDNKSTGENKQGNEFGGHRRE